MRRHREKMPNQFIPLATYNAEVRRGLVHTDQWHARMAELQAAFDRWSRTLHDVHTYYDAPPPPPPGSDPGRVTRFG